MINLVIDGKKIAASEGLTVLEAAREHGIDIPTLCYHKALGPYGVCRLCIVEGQGPSLAHTITTSCNFKISRGLVIETASPLIKEMRRTILDLMISGTVPTSPIAEMARRAGIERRRFELPREDKCILCGLCVRVCRNSIGAAALSFSTNDDNRRKVAEFVSLSPERCIGCGTCAAICPVGAISLSDDGAERSILVYEDPANRLALIPCETCGTPYTTGKFVDFVLSRLDQELRTGVKRLCPECARRHYATALTGQFPVIT